MHFWSTQICTCIKVHQLLYVLFRPVYVSKFNRANRLSLVTICNQIADRSQYTKVLVPFIHAHICMYRKDLIANSPYIYETESCLVKVEIRLATTSFGRWILHGFMYRVPQNSVLHMGRMVSRISREFIFELSLIYRERDIEQIFASQLTALTFRTACTHIIQISASIYVSKYVFVDVGVARAVIAKPFVPTPAETWLLSFPLNLNLQILQATAAKCK